MSSNFEIIPSLNLQRNSSKDWLVTLERIREDIPSRLTEKEVQNNVKYFFVEINLRKRKWLLYCSYNPHKSSISNHVEVLRMELDIHSSNYENILLLVDLNAEMIDPSLKEFCNLYSLKNLIKNPTCFKNPDNPKVIDLLLTNQPRSFCNSNETGLSGFHKLTLTVLKTYFKKQSKQLSKLQEFFKQLFRADLIKELSNNSIPEDDLIGFLDACKNSLDYQAPPKKKYIRANQVSFMTKELNKEIMTRSILRKKFLRFRSEENKKAYNQ